MLPRLNRNFARSFILFCISLIALPGYVIGQSTPEESGIVLHKSIEQTAATVAAPSSVLSTYVDPLQGASSSDLVRRALTLNTELAAARFEVERARGRLRQAGLRPNPTAEFEQTTGRLTGSAGERETTIGFALPLDVSGQRSARINLARAEFEAVEVGLADRERRLAAEVRASYAEVMAAIRELEIMENLINVDQQTARVVEVRVTEGDSSPLELNLLRSEVDRLRARRVLVEGRLQALILRLKNLVGTAPGETLRLSENLDAQILTEPPSVEAAVDIALRTRPDLRLARLTEEVAQAGLRLAHVQGRPDVTAFTRYTDNSAVFDNTPVGVLRDKDRLLTFGVSIGIPVFNRNQGAKAEAAAAIAQARKRREFAETVVRSEVASAFARYEAAKNSLTIFEQGVLDRSAQNIRSVRGAYEIGAFRVTDLLVEQRRYIDLQREFIEAMAERFRALADLQSAMGIPVIPAQNQNK
ncbi:MAG: TolC family protein [Blastocatellia bacterium]